MFHFPNKTVDYSLKHFACSAPRTVSHTWQNENAGVKRQLDLMLSLSLTG